MQTVNLTILESTSKVYLFPSLIPLIIVLNFSSPLICCVVGASVVEKCELERREKGKKRRGGEKRKEKKRKEKKRKEKKRKEKKRKEKKRKEKKRKTINRLCWNSLDKLHIICMKKLSLCL